MYDHDIDRIDGAIYSGLVGAVLKGAPTFYYLCECAVFWMNVGSVEPEYIWDRVKKGTEYESVPFKVYTHEAWADLALLIRKNGVKQTLL